MGPIQQNTQACEHKKTMKFCKHCQVAYCKNCGTNWNANPYYADLGAYQQAFVGGFQTIPNHFQGQPQTTGYMQTSGTTTSNAGFQQQLNNLANGMVADDSK
jgi:hypothetical protein